MEVLFTLFWFTILIFWGITKLAQLIKKKRQAILEQRQQRLKEVQEKELEQARELAITKFAEADVSDFFVIEQSTDKLIYKWNPKPIFNVLEIGVRVCGNNLCHKVNFQNTEIINPVFYSTGDSVIILFAYYGNWWQKSYEKRYYLREGIVCANKFKSYTLGDHGKIPEHNELIATINLSQNDIQYCKSELERAEQERREYYTELERRQIAEKIIEKQKKRTLEKEVRQKLIDDGVLFGDKTKRPPIPREVVDAVYRRDKGRCVYCGSTEELQLDHIIPFSRGGATNIENLQLLCRTCNIKKSNKIG